MGLQWRKDYEEPKEGSQGRIVTLVLSLKLVKALQRTLMNPWSPITSPHNVYVKNSMNLNHLPHIAADQHMNFICLSLVEIGFWVP